MFVPYTVVLHSITVVLNMLLVCYNTGLFVTLA